MEKPRVGRGGGDRCKVKNCSNTSKSNFSFFKVPTDPKRKEAWCRQVDIEFSDRVNLRICETHFTQNQFVSRQRLTLKSNAVPTISNPRDRCQTVTVCKPLVQAQKSVLLTVQESLNANLSGSTNVPSETKRFQESDNVVKRVKNQNDSRSQLHLNAPKPIVPQGLQNFTWNCNSAQAFPANCKHSSQNIASEQRLLPSQSTTTISQQLQNCPSIGGVQIKQSSIPIQQPHLQFQLQQQLQKSIEAQQTQPCQLVFLGLGNNGVPCFAQIQVPPSQTSQSQSEINAIRVGSSASQIPNYVDQLESSSQPDCTKKCMICKSMFSSAPRMGGIHKLEEARKLIGKFLKILNLSTNDEWEDDEMNIELPFCLACHRQVKTLVNTQDELEVLQERFESLKTDILFVLLDSFCQEKAEQEQEESVKGFYQSLSICTKMKEKLLGSNLKIPLHPTVTVMEGRDLEEDMNSQDPVSEWQGEEPIMELNIPFDEVDFEFGYSQNLSTDPESDPLALTERIGDIEIEACFKPTKGCKQYEIKKFEALYNCPATRPGLENLLPLKLRRIKCPICKKNIPGDRLSDHVVKFHSLNEQKKFTGIKEYMAASTQMVKGKERIKIMRDKFRALSKFSVNKGAPIPNHYKRVNCPICNKEIGLACLSAHINIHNGERPFKCPECPKRFYSNPNLLDHRVHHRSGLQNNSYVCDFCDKLKVFRSRKHYVKHILDVHQVSANEVLYFYTCDADKCVESYRQKEQFVQHLKSHNTNGVAFTCQSPGCEKVFARASNLESHMEEVHVDITRAIFNCKYCIKHFDNEKYWKKHESTHAIFMSSEQRVHLCDECGTGFKTIQGILIHRRKQSCHPIRNDGSEMPVKNLQTCTGRTRNTKKKSVLLKKSDTSCLMSRTCHICGKIIKQRKVMVNHLLDTHTYENKLHCYICFQEFKQRTYLESHIRRHLGQPRVTSKEKCEFCGELLPSICPLRKHCIEHHAEQYLKDKPFYCPICWLRFENQEEAAAHQMNRHERWKCKICDKQLRNRFTFEDHSRIHNSEKPYLCNFCGKGFNVLGNMREHVLRHRGIKPFYCKICPSDLRFFRKKMLKNHMDSIHSQHCLQHC